MTTDKIKLVLLPGLLNDARLWQPQIAALAAYADITVGDLTRHDTIAALAADVLAQAPPGPFAMAGLSMGGYVALEIVRQAPERVLTLALLDTNARPDTTEARAAREQLIALADEHWHEVIESLLPKLLHPKHLETGRWSRPSPQWPTVWAKKCSRASRTRSCIASTAARSCIGSVARHW